MTQTIWPRLIKNIFFSACVAFMIFFVLSWTAQCIDLIRHPFVTEYRDWGGVDLTLQLLGRHAPYSLSEGAPFFYIYGFFFPALVGIIKLAIDVDLLLLTKIVVFLCVVGAALVVAHEIYRFTTSLFFAALGFCILLWASWNQGVFFILRPDSFALLVVVLTLALLNRSQNTRTLICAAVATVLVFYSKSYFLFVLPTIILFLLASWNINGLIIFVVSVSVIFLISVGLVHAYLPGYFYASILAQAGAVGGGWDWALRQTKLFASDYWPLLLLVLIYFIQNLATGTFKTSNIRFSFSIFRKKSSAQHINIYTWYLLMALICLVPLSKNTGAYLNYFYQFLIPPIAIIGLIALSKIQSKVMQSILLFFVIGLCIFHGELKHYNLIYNKEAVANWQAAQAILKENEGQTNLISSPILAGLNSGSSLVLDQGHSEYYAGLQQSSDSTLHLINLFPHSQAYLENFIHFYKKIHRQIEQQDFRLIVVTKDYHPMIPQELLSNKYRKVQELNLRTGGQYWPTEFWIPKDPLTR